MPLMNEYTKDTIKESILNKLLRYYGCTIEEATPKQVYAAVASTVRDQIMLKWRFEKEARRDEKAERLYYLSIEFLTGRWLHNNLLNLCSTKEYEEAFSELGLTLRGVLHRSRNRRWATAASAVWPRASLTLWRLWIFRPWAAPSATSTACSVSASLTASRLRCRTSG